MSPRHGGCAPARARSSLWRRLLSGDPPELVSSVWPAFGERVEVNGSAFREVVFVREAPGEGHRVMIHLNGVTDAHRSDIRPALLDDVPGSTLRVIDYLLPDDLIASYRFVSLPVAELADDVGATREGWLRVHAAGAPDARNPRRLPNPLGRWSSVLVAPGAVEHPAWDAAGLPVRRVEQTALPLQADDAGLSATVLTTTPQPTATTGARLLVLFDGENWQRLGIRDALTREAAASAPDTVVLVPSGSSEQRSAVLPHPERVAQLFEAVSTALRAHTGVVVDPGRTVVAGQSYGGLAAAALVSLRQDLVSTAVVQSGSFHFRADEDPRPPVGQTGDLLERIVQLDGSDRLAGRRLVVQSGTEEAGMTASARRFAQAVRRAGALTVRHEYSGGHDYAWWRTGLFDALDELAGLEGWGRSRRRRCADGCAHCLLEAGRSGPLLHLRRR